MTSCTAPVRGHDSPAARAACPFCGPTGKVARMLGVAGTPPPTPRRETDLEARATMLLALDEELGRTLTAGERRRILLALGLDAAEREHERDLVLASAEVWYVPRGDANSADAQFVDAAIDRDVRLPDYLNDSALEELDAVLRAAIRESLAADGWRLVMLDGARGDGDGDALDADWDQGDAIAVRLARDPLARLGARLDIPANNREALEYLASQDLAAALQEPEPRLLALTLFPNP